MPAASETTSVFPVFARGMLGSRTSKKRLLKFIVAVSNQQVEREKAWIAAMEQQVFKLRRPGRVHAQQRGRNLRLLRDLG